MFNVIDIDEVMCCVPSFQVDKSRSTFYNLTPQFRSQHYLTGLVLSDLSVSFDAR